MNIFDAKAAADKVLAEYAIGDIISPDAVDEIIEMRRPNDNDSYSLGKQLEFDHMNRVNVLRAELLSRKVLAVREHYALALIKPEHHVDRAMRRVQRKLDDVLLRGMHEVENLDTTGLANSLIMEQHDAMARLDMLRTAHNPRSRRTKFGTAIKAVK